MNKIAIRNLECEGVCHSSHHRLQLQIMTMILLLSSVMFTSTAVAQANVTSSTEGTRDIPRTLLGSNGSADPVSSGFGSSPMQLPDLTNKQNVSSALQIIILLTVLSLVPAIILMTTCFTRIVIVLSLLRQALGTQQLPPNQVMVGLAMFMTFLVMTPTWNKINTDALQPYMDGKMDQPTALKAAQVPIRNFMIKNIVACGNEEDVFLFTDFQHLEVKFLM